MNTLNDFRKIALLVVDMQRYYLQPDSDFHRYCEARRPGCMAYISRRSHSVVIPNIARLLEAFRSTGAPVIFLKLCSRDAERRDLHRFFHETWSAARPHGFRNVYPLHDQAMAGVVDALAPVERAGEAVVEKRTFSGFTESALHDRLQDLGITTLVVSGLATSQCVETTARDASERGYEIVHIEDAQADYDEQMHYASLYASQAVCGGDVRSTLEFLKEFSVDTDV